MIQHTEELLLLVNLLITIANVADVDGIANGSLPTVSKRSN